MLCDHSLKNKVFIILVVWTFCWTIVILFSNENSFNETLMKSLSEPFWRWRLFVHFAKRDSKRSESVKLSILPIINWSSRILNGVSRGAVVVRHGIYFRRLKIQCIPIKWTKLFFEVHNLPQLFFCIRVTRGIVSALVVVLFGHSVFFVKKKKW